MRYYIKDGKAWIKCNKFYFDHFRGEKETINEID